MFTGSIRAIVTGIAATAVLLAVLAASRLWKAAEASEQIEVIEIQPVLPAPEEPPLEEPEDEVEPEELVETPALPVPALDLMVSREMEAPTLPKSAIQWDSNMGVDTMSLDRAPAELPLKKVSRPISKPATKANSKPTKRPTTKSKPIKTKAYYSPGELDGLPRQLRQGRYTWPRRAKGKSGTVRLKLEISSSGRVTVISVLSATDPALIEAAKKLARTSSYTAPKKNGKAVKARFTKTYKLIKPR